MPPKKRPRHTVVKGKKVSTNTRKSNQNNEPEEAEVNNKKHITGAITKKRLFENYKFRIKIKTVIETTHWK